MNQNELSLKYPSLNIEFGYLFKIADLYKIDLSEANLKQWGGGRFGAIEGDINLDIVGLIHDYKFTDKESSPLISYIKSELHNYGYESPEIKSALCKIEGLK